MQPRCFAAQCIILAPWHQVNFHKKVEQCALVRHLTVAIIVEWLVCVIIFASSLSASTCMPFASWCAPSASSCAAPATNCLTWWAEETFCYCLSMKKTAVTCGSVQGWLCPWFPTCDARSSFIARALCEWAASCRSLRRGKTSFRRGYCRRTQKVVVVPRLASPVYGAYIHGFLEKQGIGIHFFTVPLSRRNPLQVAEAPWWAQACRRSVELQLHSFLTTNPTVQVNIQMFVLSQLT